MTEGAGGDADACHCQNEAQRPGVPAIETEQVECGTPVSYTHLDVYKRQLFQSPQRPLA